MLSCHVKRWAKSPPGSFIRTRACQSRCRVHAGHVNQDAPATHQRWWSSAMIPEPLIAIAAALVMVGTSCPAMARDLTPYELAKSLPYGVMESTGQLRSCPTNINPNCVATTISGSTNDTYSPAWRANETDAVKAARALEEAFQDLYDKDAGRLLTSQHIDGLGEYRAFGVKSAFGVDVAEFLIKSDDREGALVTYRSMAGSTKYLWPIQQPIGDFDAQRKRMKTVRQQLGWQVIGCEVFEECY